MVAIYMSRLISINKPGLVYSTRRRSARPALIKEEATVEKDVKLKK